MEMEMEFLRKLPTPQELKEQFPVSTEVVAVKAQRDEDIPIFNKANSRQTTLLALLLKYLFQKQF